MDLIYLQCDIRYNPWMLEKIDNKYVIDHTLDKCRKLDGGDCKIIAGIYNCYENKELIDILLNHGVDVRITDEDNVNSRFLDIVIEEEDKYEYVIRIGGDQCLLDPYKTNEILNEMKKRSKDWYYESCSSCILPDIVRLECLEKYKMVLKEGNRYFEILNEQEGIERYEPLYPILILFNFRVNSNESLRVCRHVIKNHLNIYELSKKLLPNLINNSYLTKTGLLGSWILPEEVGDFFYDENKEVNPWWGKSIADLIKKHLNQSMRVFEWGCGNSTLFWSRHVKEVVSIEHDRNWYERMSNIVPDNVRMEYCELKYGGDYCKTVLSEKRRFDIILVDGRDRVRCMINAAPFLKESGILILDDSERINYKEGSDYLIGCGFKKLELSSLVYGIPGYEQFTSIFYKNSNFIGI